MRSCTPSLMTHSIPVVLSALAALNLTGVSSDLVSTEPPPLRLESIPTNVPFTPETNQTSDYARFTNRSFLEGQLSPNGTSFTIDLTSSRVGLHVRFRF
jgi:hypothetical protein